MSMDGYFSTKLIGNGTGKRNCVTLDNQVKIQAGKTQKEVPDKTAHNIERHLVRNRFVRDELQ